MENRDKIKELHKKLETAEETDYLYFSKDLRDLRHRVMYVHSRIEGSLESLLVKEVIGKPPYTEDLGKRLVSQLAILSELDFARKVTLVQKMGLITEPLRKDIMKINEVRKYFSHPSKFLEKIFEYKKEDKVAETLELLVNTLEEFSKKSQKELKKIEEFEVGKTSQEEKKQ